VAAGSERYRRAIGVYLKSLGRKDIRLVETEGDPTLGRMRNLSLEAARGEILCQWDDDDLYHPDRMSVQWRRMQEADARACFFVDVLQFDLTERTLCWIDWSALEQVKAGYQWIPGTVMIENDTRLRYPEEGDAAGSGEDSALIDRFSADLKMTGLRKAGYLYVYRYHGRNTVPRARHRAMTLNHVVSDAFVRSREAEFRSALHYYRLPRPYVVRTGRGTLNLAES
ncbi:MAG: glycosyltransferase family A protein, partial [Verrucomicrobiota bacterium]